MTEENRKTVYEHTLKFNGVKTGSITICEGCPNYDKDIYVCIFKCLEVKNDISGKNDSISEKK